MPQHTVALSEAQKRVDTYMDSARQAISNQAKLVNENGAAAGTPFDPDVSACEDASGQATNTYNVGKQRRLEGVSQADQPYEKFRSWVGRNGFTITSDHAKDRDTQYLIARNHQGYGVTVQSAKGTFFLIGSSPCARKNGESASNSS